MKTTNMTAGILLVSVLPPIACSEVAGDGDDATGVISEADTGGAVDTSESSVPESDGNDSNSDSSGDGDGDGTSSNGGDGDGDGDDGACGLADPGPIPAMLGAPAHHYENITHTGELLNLCSLGGKTIGIDISTVTCGPCNSWAACLTYLDPEYCEASINVEIDGKEITEIATEIRARIDAGEIHYVTALSEGADLGEPPTLQDLQAWASAYPYPNHYVLSDGDLVLNDQVFGVSGWPYFTVIDEQFNYKVVDDDIYKFLTELMG